MFSIEHEFDTTIITIMDDSGIEEDVVIELSDKHVDVRQFNETLQKYDLLTLSPKMFYEILQSFNYPEGLYEVELQRDPLK